MSLVGLRPPLSYTFSMPVFFNGALCDTYTQPQEHHRLFYLN